ncbi:Hypothetical protein PBC10988_13210 [Planctomycetales bacterium 10988]|nr:Hypothetical protein PBC10988_13210 [Planctomycetales bacterium 10988]
MPPKAEAQFTLLIDGYNLIHAAGLLGRGLGPGGLERARRSLLNQIANTLSQAERPRTAIVFDANDGPSDQPSRSRFREMWIYFAVQVPDADTLIEELIRANSAPKRLSVVSSDHRIQTAAKRRKSQFFDSEIWFQQQQNRQTRSGNPTKRKTFKPSHPPPEEEVAFWMKQFQDQGLFDKKRDKKS